MFPFKIRSDEMIHRHLETTIAESTKEVKTTIFTDTHNPAYKTTTLQIKHGEDNNKTTQCHQTQRHFHSSSSTDDNKPPGKVGYQHASWEKKSELGIGPRNGIFWTEQEGRLVRPADGVGSARG